MSQVTSFAQLQEYAKGQVVDLPPFADGMPLTARMRRPSMLGMMKSGKIPNTLLRSANALFSGTTAEQSGDDDELYAEVFEITEILAQTALLEPTYEQICNPPQNPHKPGEPGYDPNFVPGAGLELTDDQLMFLFSYTQMGVKALDSFRPVQTDSASAALEQPVQGQTE